MLNLNGAVFLFINNLAGAWQVLDVFFVWVTSYVAYSLFFFVALYAIFYVPMRAPMEKKARAWKRGMYILISVLTTGVFVYIIKYAIKYPRPFEVFSDAVVLAPIVGGTSFPSAHTALTMALAVATYQWYPRLGRILIVLAFLIGFSRIFVGVHYPLDILVGFFIGTVIPLLVRFVWER